jgi:hypothetical protein
MRFMLTRVARDIVGTVALSLYLAGCSSGSASPDASGSAGAGGGGGVGGGGGSAGAAAAVTVASGEDLPGAVAVDDSFVYWTTTTAVRRSAKSGGSAMTLFSSQGSGDNLIIDGTNLYWRNATTPNGVFSGPTTGGQATMVVGGLPSNFALDADSIYWIDAGDLMLRRASKANGGTAQVLAGPGTFGTLVIDDQFLYWVEGAGRVRRIAKTGGSITDLRPADSTPGLRASWTAADDTNVYFGADTTTAQTGVLIRVEKTGGAGEMLAGDLDSADAIAVGGDAVYWLTRGDSGSGYLARIPRTGGAPTILASGLGLTIGIALDAEYAYWTEGGDPGARNGLIRRVPR